MKTLCKARKRGGRHWYHSNRHDFAYNRPVDPDPMFFGHPGFGSSCQSLEEVLGIRIKGVDDQKFKKNRWKFFISFLKQKIVIYLLLGLHKGCLVYRGSLQPSKENIPHLLFCIFRAHFCPPGSGSTTLIRGTAPNSYPSVMKRK